MHAQMQADSNRFVGRETKWEYEVKISHAQGLRSPAIDHKLL